LGELGKGVVTLTKTHSRGFFNIQYLFQVSILGVGQPSHFIAFVLSDLNMS